MKRDNVFLLVFGAFVLGLLFGYFGGQFDDRWAIKREGHTIPHLFSSERIVGHIEVKSDEWKEVQP